MVITVKFKLNPNKFIASILDTMTSDYIDTVNINIKEMMKLGLKKENIVASQKCTMCNSLEYHSFRKDKENSGRNVALICMK